MKKILLAIAALCATSPLQCNGSPAPLTVASQILLAAGGIGIFGGFAICADATLDWDISPEEDYARTCVGLKTCAGGAALAVFAVLLGRAANT